MIRLVTKRLLGSVFVLFVVSVVAFLVFQLAPKLSNVSPAYYYVGRLPPDAAGLARIEERFGFNLPLVQQYWNWLSGLIVGRSIDDGSGTVIDCLAPCLGYSFRLNEPVTALVAEAIPVSFSLVLGAAVLWLLLGVTAGVLSAVKKGRPLDRVSMFFSLLGVSAPVFVTGPVLMLVFSYSLGWLPSAGYVPLSEDPLGWLQSMILPWIALALVYAALYTRITRANVLEVMQEDYIVTAHAKGLKPATVFTKHGLRAAVTPLITLLGMDFATLLGGSIIAETVFNLNGLGKLAINAITSQDLPVIMGVTIVAALFIVIVTIVTDIIYGVADPRVRRG